MANLNDLRRQKSQPPDRPARRPVAVSTVPDGTQADQLVGHGQLPLPVGRTVVTPAEKRRLEKLGWRPGQPVPDLIAQEVEDLVEEAEPGDVPPVPLNTPPLKMPKLVNPEDLPPEHRRRLQEAMVQGQEQLRQLAEAQARPQTQLNPSVAKAVSETSREGPAVPLGRPLTVDQFNQVKGRLSVGADAADAVKVKLDTERFTGQQAPEADPAREGEVPTVPAAHGFCPRCFFRQGDPDPIKIDEVDKYAYLASLLGRRRFTKRVPLMGGKLAITFRTLTAREGDAAIRQLTIDAADQLTQGEAERPLTYWHNLIVYRMVMAVQRVELGDPGTPDYQVINVDTLDEYELQPGELKPGDTKLKPFHDSVMDLVLYSEELRGMAGVWHRHFEDMMRKIQSLAGEEGFWAGGVQPP